MSEFFTLLTVSSFGMAVFLVGLLLGRRFVDSMLMPRRIKIDPNQPIVIPVPRDRIREKQLA